MKCVINIAILGPEWGLVYDYFLLQVAVAILQDSSNGQLTVEYSAAKFTVTSVESRGSAIALVQPPNTTLYIGLGAGLGVGLLLLVVIAMVLSTVIYIYRRSVVLCMSVQLSRDCYTTSTQEVQASECPLLEATSNPCTVHIHSRGGDGRG